jgi:hypothetical protein
MDFLEKHNAEHTLSTLTGRPTDAQRDAKINEIIGKLNDVLALFAGDESKL